MIDVGANDRREELRGAGLTVVMAFLFACVVIFGKSVLNGRLPFVILGFRFAGTAAIIAVVLVATGRPLVPEPGERLGLALAGTLGYGTEAAFYFSALNHGNTAAVTVLFYTYPVIVMLATIALDRRAPARMLFAALGLAVGGSAIVVVGGGGVEVQPFGIVLALCCATAYSAYLIATDRVVKRTPPMTSALWLAAGAATSNLVYAFAFDARTMPAGVSTWLKISGMAIFTAAAFVAMLASLQRIGAVRNAIIGVLEPLTVAILAFVFLSEPISAAVAIGGSLILVGAVLATLVRTTGLREPDV